jgi:small basic protein
MTAAIPVLALIAGIVSGWFLFSSLGVGEEQARAFAPYLSLATLAGLDTVLGGIRAGIDGRFEDDIFVSGFLLNTMLAALLAWLGDLIGVDLFLAAVVALGTRVFLNLSLIRRYYLTKRALKKQAREAPAALSSS